jgi:hypothetical protein
MTSFTLVRVHDILATTVSAYFYIYIFFEPPLMGLTAIGGRAIHYSSSIYWGSTCFNILIFLYKGGKL